MRPVIPEVGDHPAQFPGVVVRVANVFDPTRGRQVDPVDDPISVRGWLDGQGIAEFTQPTLCLFNGRALLRDAWDATRIERGDVCAFVALPHGGGGGGGGKSPLKIVLSIAVMVAGAYMGGLAAGWFADTVLMGGAMGPLTAGQALGAKLFGGLVGGVVGMAGNALVSTLVPAGRSAAPAASWGGSAATAAPSPTYSLTAQGNHARLGQPIPVVYGRHQIFPDFASEPFQEYVDNEQFLHQLHVIGQGEFDVDSIILRIDDTPITSFEEVTTEVVAPGGSVTLFEADVVTAPEVAGQELKGPNQLDAGEDGWVGPFTVCGTDRQADHIGIDILFSRGLYYANTSGGLDSKTAEWVVEARAIDADGDPVGDGAWGQLGSESHTAATNTAIRLSFKYTVVDARYEVRIQRLDDKDTDARAGHEIRWGQARGYLTGEPDFGNVTLLAVKMRGTDNLSSRSSRLINAVVTRKLPIWNVESQTWSAPTATRSIAWAIADVCRAEYGAELSDMRLPLDELAALDTLWESRNNHFDAVFDTQMTVWEALGRIARCGRAVPILQGGRARIIRDGPQAVPVAMFNGRNIVKGSFKLQYIMPSEDTADAVTMEFFNARTWKPDETTGRVRDDDYTAWLTAEGKTDTAAARTEWAELADKPAKVQLFGCTDATHALEEAEYSAGDNRWRRRIATFRTELDGMIPTYGDLIAVVHDMPRWGKGGEVVDWTADDIADPEAVPPWANAVLMLSEPPVWAEGAIHHIALRKRDGSPAGPFEVVAGANANQVMLAEPMTVTPYVGSQEERTYYSFGAGDAWARLCRVLSIRPRQGGEQVEITAVAEDARVHDTELDA